MPQGLQWEFWRIVSSEHFQVGLQEVRNEWSLEDLLDAHLTLDVLEDVRAKNHQGNSHDRPP